VLCGERASAAISGKWGNRISHRSGADKINTIFSILKNTKGNIRVLLAFLIGAGFILNIEGKSKRQNKFQNIYCFL